MEQMSEKLVSICEYEVEDGSSLIFVHRKKPHRKIIAGLKLLTELCKTVRPSSNVSMHEFKGGLEEEVFKQQSEFPHDVFMHQILARLPIKSLLASNSVSKYWYSTVSSNEFANVHYKSCLSRFHPSSPIEYLFIQEVNSYCLFYLQEDSIVLDYSLVKLEPNFDCNNQDELCLVDVCNGLVCLSDSFNGCFYIWNPIVYRWKKYFHPCSFSFSYRTSWGFAHISSVGDYKVVKIAENHNTQEIIVFIFSFRTKEWKEIHGHGLSHRVSLTKNNPGVLVNDTLFWIMKTKDVQKKHVVVGFNLILEKFDEFNGLIPSGCSTTTFQDHFLCVMDGCLSLCSANVRNETYLSIMKESGKVELILLPNYSDSFLVGSTKNGKAFMVSKNMELALVDLSSSPTQYFSLVNLKGVRRPYMVSYFPSLISPCVA